MSFMHGLIKGYELRDYAPESAFAFDVYGNPMLFALPGSEGVEQTFYDPPPPSSSVAVPFWSRIDLSPSLEEQRLAQQLRERVQRNQVPQQNQTQQNPSAQQNPNKPAPVNGSFDLKSLLSNPTILIGGAILLALLLKRK